MAEVNLYQIYCITESINVPKWDTVPLTVCPNNNSHTVNPNSVVILDSVKTQEVIIDEGDSGTGMNYMLDGYSFNINPGIGVVTTINLSYPYPITIFSINLQQGVNNIGDKFDIIAMPNTTVGVLTADLNIGGNVLNVSSTVIDNVMVGYLIILDDGTNNQKMGRISSIDTVNNTVTTTETSLFNFSAITPTMVMIEIPRIYNHHINIGGSIVFGEKKIGGTATPANTVFQIRYTNSTLLGKKFIFTLEILY